MIIIFLVKIVILSYLLNTMIITIVCFAKLWNDDNNNDKNNNDKNNNNNNNINTNDNNNYNNSKNYNNYMCEKRHF